MTGFGKLHMMLERLDDDLRNQSDPVAIAIPVTNDDLLEGEIDILHPEPEALHQTQPAAVQDLRQEEMGSSQMRKNMLDFRFGQDGWQPLPFLAHWTLMKPGPGAGRFYTGTRGC